MPALIDTNSPYPLYAVFSPTAASTPRVTSTGVPARSTGGQTFAPPTAAANVKLANGGTSSANNGTRLKIVLLVGIAAYLLLRGL